MEGRCKIRKNGEWSGKNEKIEFNGSIRRDRGHPERAECMVSITGSVVYHADSGDLRSDIVQKGRTIRKK